MDEVPYEEVNLRDYIEVILKYKWLIIGIFVVALVTTGVTNYIMPKTYKSEATIEIGQVGIEVDEGETSTAKKSPIYSQAESKQLILSEKVLQPVINKYADNFREKPSIGSFRKKVEVENVEDTNYVNVTLRHKDPEATKDMLQSIINHFFEIGNKKYEKKMSLLKQDLEVTKKQVQGAKDSLQDLKSKVASLTKEGMKIPLEMMSKIILLKQVISETQNDYFKYLEKKSSINQKIQQATPFKIINSPQVSETAIAPKKKQNLAISGVVSLMFAIFLAFFIEFMRTSEPSKEIRSGEEVIRK